MLGEVWNHALVGLCFPLLGAGNMTAKAGWGLQQWWRWSHSVGDISGLLSPCHLQWRHCAVTGDTQSSGDWEGFPQESPPCSPLLSYCLFFKKIKIKGNTCAQLKRKTVQCIFPKIFWTHTSSMLHVCVFACLHLTRVIAHVRQRTLNDRSVSTKST